jgi:F0F1-type ATP synthase assembly protein I
MLTSIPILLAVSPLVGYFMGRVLDRWLSTTPWLSLIFLGFGFAAGVRETIKIVKRASQD